MVVDITHIVHISGRDARTVASVVVRAEGASRLRPASTSNVSIVEASHTLLKSASAVESVDSVVGAQMRP